MADEVVLGAVWHKPDTGARRPAFLDGSATGTPDGKSSSLFLGTIEEFDGCAIAEVLGDGALFLGIGHSPRVPQTRTSSQAAKNALPLPLVRYNMLQRRLTV